MDSAFINYLQQIKPLPEADQQLILSYFRESTYKEGSVLFKEGNVCRDMYFISSGVLRFVISDEKGNEITYFFLSENQFCTVLYSFTGNTIAHESIVAATNVTVLHIGHTNLTKLCALLPYFKPLLDGVLQRQLMEKVRIKNAYQGKEALTAYQMFIEQYPSIAQRVALKDVASFLNITPQSLSRLRRRKS